VKAGTTDAFTGVRCAEKINKSLLSSAKLRGIMYATSRGDLVMKRFILIPALAAVGLLSACSTGPTIRSDYDHNVNFAQYRSFGFMSPLGTDHGGYTSLFTERLKTATRGQMEMRGYVYSEQAPDLLVNFSAKLQNKTQVVAAPPVMPMGPYYGYYGYRTGFYGGWPGYYGFGEDVYQYTEGTLNIDLIDARKRQLVWEGISTGVIDDIATASSAKSIDANVAEIFQRFPFRAGSDVPQVPQAQSVK
jgi:hypothetical protein